MRQIVLDTETTGLDPAQGHRMIEVGCVELIERRRTGNNFHYYLQPDRAIDWGALEVHGITREFLSDKPRFSEVAEELLQYIKNAEIIIHNADFDVGFLDFELQHVEKTTGQTLGRIADYCQITDTLRLARQMHPGQRNSLDALCKRYHVDNSTRTVHGALLDADLLTDVYLSMTGGQTSLALDVKPQVAVNMTQRKLIDLDRLQLTVVKASDNELVAHQKMLDQIQEASADGCVWHQLASSV